MDEFGEKDTFILSGKTFEIEKGKRYRISCRNGNVYEGRYLGFMENYPLCQAVTMVEVARVTESRVIVDEKTVFYAFEKRHILCIEEIEHDLASRLKVIGPKNPDDYSGPELN